MSDKRYNIVDKETLIVHAPSVHEEAYSFRVPPCGLELRAGQWHSAWRSPPDDRVTCVLCLGSVDG